MDNHVEFVVYGEPASKANSRQLVYHKNRHGKTISRFVKSKKANDYVAAFSLQCPQLPQPIEDDVSVTIKIFYASRRPDLDESVVLDCMQSEVHNDKKTKIKTILRNNIYKNDRQVKEKHIYWGLDKENPRCEIKVEIIDA